MNSETDFVARNEQFQTLVRGVAGVALENGGDFDATNAATYPGASHSVEAEVTEAVGTIGENMTFRRSAGLTVPNGVVSCNVFQISRGLRYPSSTAGLDHRKVARVLRKIPYCSRH